MDHDMIARLPGWEARLSAHIVAHLNAPFEWGKTDCVMFSAGAVRALSGVDLVRGMRGYRSLAEGLRFARAKGFRAYEDIFARRLRVASVEMLAPGDVVVVEQNDQDIMGIFGGTVAHVMTEAGCQTLDAGQIVRGYAV